MTSCLRLFALALAAGFVVPAPAADAPPVVVQERVLMRPKLPEDEPVPMNVPESGAVRMPFVTGGAQGVARRINEAVWHEMLEGVPIPSTPGKNFTPRADQLPQGTTSLQYAARLLPAASPRLLSLDLSGEGCGAYCEDFAWTRIFDLRDGRRIVLGGLLTVDGFAALGRRVDEQRRRAYQAQLRELRAMRKAAPKGRNKADDDDTEDRIFLNETCLEQATSEPSTPERLASEDFALDGRGGLRLTVERCSNHAMRALDDVGAIQIAVPSADLRPWLTPYGLAIVLQEGDAPPPAASFTGRTLHGRLAGQPITMTLEPLRDDGETRGSYQYDKFRVPIALSARKEGDTIRAFEATASGGEFELEPAGGALVGTWRDKEHRRQLPVILQ